MGDPGDSWCSQGILADLSMEPSVAVPDQLAYFARPRLLDVTLKLLRIDLKQGVVVYAPRGKGKTSFLLHDLFPACEACGLAAAYVNLRNHCSDPGRALLEGIERLGDGGSGCDRSSMPRPACTGARTADPLLRLRRLVQGIVAAHGRLVLVLDNFDVIARTGAENLIAALRTVLQDERGRLSVVYSGSCVNALNELFRRRQAPFFESAMFLPLPDLGGDFVEDRARVFAERTGLAARPGELNQAFEHVGRFPGHLNWIALDMIRCRSAHVKASQERWLRRDRESG